MFILQRIPKTGDHIELNELRYEVVDMDGHRIDKVLITQVLVTPGIEYHTFQEDKR